MRKQDLRDGMRKVYSTIRNDYCTKEMRSRIGNHVDFKAKIDDDPIELLKAIQMLMHDTVRAQYPYVSMTESILHVLNIRQQE